MRAGVPVARKCYLYTVGRWLAKQQIPFLVHTAHLKDKLLLSFLFLQTCCVQQPLKLFSAAAQWPVWQVLCF